MNNFKLFVNTTLSLVLFSFNSVSSASVFKGGGVMENTETKKQRTKETNNSSQETKQTQSKGTLAYVFPITSQTGEETKPTVLEVRILEAKQGALERIIDSNSKPGQPSAWIPGVNQSNKSILSIEADILDPETGKIHLASSNEVYIKNSGGLTGFFGKSLSLSGMDLNIKLGSWSFETEFSRPKRITIGVVGKGERVSTLQNSSYAYSNVEAAELAEKINRNENTALLDYKMTQSRVDLQNRIERVVVDEAYPGAFKKLLARFPAVGSKKIVFNTKSSFLKFPLSVSYVVQTGDELRVYKGAPSYLVVQNGQIISVHGVDLVQIGGAQTVEKGVRWNITTKGPEGEPKTMILTELTLPGTVNSAIPQMFGYADNYKRTRTAVRCEPVFQLAL